MSRATRAAKRRLTPAQYEDLSLRGIRASQLWTGRAVLSVREVAEALHVSEQHVLNLITQGRLRGINITSALRSKAAPKTRIPRREYWRIPLSAWDAFIQENAS